MQHSTTPASTRHLNLEGTYNLRDMGGYPTLDGRAVRWRTFFRSDSLHRLPLVAQTTLMGYGVRTVIDLRRSDELQVAPNVFAGSSDVAYHHVSLLLDTPPIRRCAAPLAYSISPAAPITSNSSRLVIGTDVTGDIICLRFNSFHLGFDSFEVRVEPAYRAARNR